MQTNMPIPWRGSDILKAVSGELLSKSIEHLFKGISINSRKISGSDLFVAIKGKIYDGHTFVDDVIKKNIKGILINRQSAGQMPMTKWQEKKIFCCAVPDTVKALGDLASYNRTRSGISTIAITGSNGKTTTKEMTASILKKKFNTLSSKGNFNNEIGLPLTLFNISPSHEWAVLELGMNHPGEIGRLAEICMPDIGVITNIGSAHLEGLGSLEGIMNAKGELLEKIKPGGTAVLNGDDPRVMLLSQKTKNKTLIFGKGSNAEIKAVSVERKGTGTCFKLELPFETMPIELKIPGGFMVSNALASAASGYLLGFTAKEIKAGIEDFKPANGRMSIIKTHRGVNIIDDTYNSNPDSMEAAIKTLKDLKQSSDSILITGDMLELGEHAELMHKKIGSMAAQSKITRLYATGSFAEKVAEGALDENMDSKKIFTGTNKEITDDLSLRLKEGDWLLVKGSRATGMEIIVKKIKGRA